MKKTKLLFLNAVVKWKSGNISQHFRQRTNKLLSRLDVATLGHHLVTLHSWYYSQFKETNQRQLTLSNRVSSSRADVTKKFAPSAIPSTQSEKLYLKEIPNEQTTDSRLSKYLRDVTSEKFYTGFGCSSLLSSGSQTRWHECRRTEELGDSNVLVCLQAGIKKSKTKGRIKSIFFCLTLNHIHRL